MTDDLTPAERLALDFSQTLTTLPCPDWCTLPAGHALAESWAGAGDYSRWHERDVSQDTGAAWVHLTSHETALTPHGPADEALAFVGIGHERETVMVPLAHARAVAAALLQAVALHDPIDDGEAGVA